jgi:hypothetical protein
MNIEFSLESFETMGLLFFLGPALIFRKTLKVCGETNGGIQLRSEPVEVATSLYAKSAAQQRLSGYTYDHRP